MTRRCTALVVGALFLLPSNAQSACQLELGPERTVARVVDGETIKLDDASEVRLIGILSPHRHDVDAAEQAWPAEVRAKAELEALVQGAAVTLKFDGPRRDRHGRTLAHVFLTRGKETLWVQAVLASAGMVRVVALDGQRTCVADLLAAEDQALSSGIGVWSEPTYRVRAPKPPRDLLRFRGRYVVVRGKIEEVVEARDGIRLYFGSDVRRDLSVSIRRGDRITLGGIGGDARALKGRSIEARGWVGQRAGSFGPDIDISSAGLMRRLD